MINVLAGVNGAGKSSVVGETFRARGADYFNPDEAARLAMDANRSLGLEQANAEAWQRGLELLRYAIDADRTWTFETTLGGDSITSELLRAIALGRRVRLFYVGLSSPELHIARVRDRVAAGGHPIAEQAIRRRWVHSRTNLVKLVPGSAMVKLFDNSAPLRDGRPDPALVLHLADRRWITPPTADIPEWAKPAAYEALRALGTP